MSWIKFTSVRVHHIIGLNQAIPQLDEIGCGISLSFECAIQTGGDVSNEVILNLE